MVSVKAFSESVSRLVERVKRVFTEGEYYGYTWDDDLFGMPVKVEAGRTEMGHVNVVVREKPTGALFLSLTLDPELENITEVEAHF
jgi:hypothetical protein